MSHTEVMTYIYIVIQCWNEGVLMHEKPYLYYNSYLNIGTCMSTCGKQVCCMHQHTFNPHNMYM